MVPQSIVRHYTKLANVLQGCKHLPGTITLAYFGGKSGITGEKKFYKVCLCLVEQTVSFSCKIGTKMTV